MEVDVMEQVVAGIFRYVGRVATGRDGDGCEFADRLVMTRIVVDANGDGQEFVEDIAIMQEGGVPILQIL